MDTLPLLYSTLLGQGADFVFDIPKIKHNIVASDMSDINVIQWLKNMTGRRYTIIYTLTFIEKCILSIHCKPFNRLTLL